MKSFFILISTLALLLGGCSEIKQAPVAAPVAVAPPPAETAEEAPRDTSPMERILRAELRAEPAARKVLQTGRQLALEEQAIIRGGCWNWINTVFKRSGYADQSHVVFEGRKKGPYVSQEEIRPGDWLYYVNHAYKRVGHSGLFVHWVDFEKKIGMILSYGGEGRREPARYQTYDLSDVYYIRRPGEDPALAGDNPEPDSGKSG
jgi:hypothetical protein